jgi:hypothetical protein
MQIENDYDKEVYNGDVGELTAIFDGRSVTYGFGELDTLVPAYAARPLFELETSPTQRRICALAKEAERRPLGDPNQVEKPNAFFAERLVEAGDLFGFKA